MEAAALVAGGATFARLVDGVLSGQRERVRHLVFRDARDSTGRPIPETDVVVVCMLRRHNGFIQSL